jgi:hypothetical protein
MVGGDPVMIDHGEVEARPPEREPIRLAVHSLVLRKGLLEVVARGYGPIDAVNTRCPVTLLGVDGSCVMTCVTHLSWHEVQVSEILDLTLRLDLSDASSTRADVIEP